MFVFLLMVVLAARAYILTREHERSIAAGLQNYVRLTADGLWPQAAAAVQSIGDVALIAARKDARFAELLDAGGVPEMEPPFWQDEWVIARFMLLGDTAVVSDGVIGFDGAVQLADRALRTVPGSPTTQHRTHHITSVMHQGYPVVLAVTHDSSEIRGPWTFGTLLKPAIMQALADIAFRTDVVAAAGIEVNELPSFSWRIETVDGIPLAVDSPSYTEGVTARREIDARQSDFWVRATLHPEARSVLTVSAPPTNFTLFSVVQLFGAAILLGWAIHQWGRQLALTNARYDFLAAIAHDLRTPLAQIRLYNDLIALGMNSEEERKEVSEVIDRETQRLTYLVESAFAFIRAETSNVGERERFDLAPELRQTVVGYRKIAEAEGVALHFSANGAADVVGDRQALRGVVINLLDNAVKYAAHGKHVHIGYEAGDVVRFWVQDEGDGVPPEARERIFKPYMRGVRPLDRARGGAGIGLATVQRTVRAHGGEVWVEAAEPQGARFVVSIPAAPHEETT